MSKKSPKSSNKGVLGASAKKPPRSTASTGPNARAKGRRSNASDRSRGAAQAEDEMIARAFARGQSEKVVWYERHIREQFIEGRGGTKWFGMRIPQTIRDMNSSLAEATAHYVEEIERKASLWDMREERLPPKPIVNPVKPWSPGNLPAHGNGLVTCPMCLGLGVAPKPKDRDAKYYRDAEMAKKLRAQGYSMRQIVAMLGFKSPRTAMILLARATPTTKRKSR